MGFLPFELEYKEESLVGCEREEGGDSSFMAMGVELSWANWFCLWVAGKGLSLYNIFSYCYEIALTVSCMSVRVSCHFDFSFVVEKWDHIQFIIHFFKPPPHYKFYLKPFIYLFMDEFLCHQISIIIFFLKKEKPIINYEIVITPPHFCHSYQSAHIQNLTFHSIMMQRHFLYNF